MKTRFAKCFALLIALAFAAPAFAAPAFANVGSGRGSSDQTDSSSRNSPGTAGQYDAQKSQDKLQKDQEGDRPGTLPPPASPTPPSNTEPQQPGQVPFTQDWGQQPAAPPQQPGSSG